MSDDGLTLAAVSRAAGMLPPSAVCHIGRCVSEVLAQLHECGSGCAPTAENVIVDDRGAVLFIPAGARSVPLLDLHALGVILSELALGHPFGGGAGIRTLGGGLPDRLVDALEVLVAPEDRRLRHASAAVRMFTELEKLYGDGTAALADAVSRAKRNALRDTVPGGVQAEPRTVEMSRDAILSLQDLRRLAPSTPSPRSPQLAPQFAPPTSSPAPLNTASVDVHGNQGPRAEPTTQPLLPVADPRAPSAANAASAPSAANAASAASAKPNADYVATSGSQRKLLIAAGLLAIAVLVVIAFFVGVHFGAKR